MVMTVRNGKLQVLLWRRAESPQAGRWALPGGALGPQERLGAAVARHLANKVEVQRLSHLEQLETRSDPGRDPRRRVLATAYLGLVPADAEPELPDDTRWHAVDALPATAFDHGSIAASGRARLRAKLSYTTIGFALAADTFTISQLRDIYSAALGRDVAATNLQRVLLRRGVIERTDTVVPPTEHGGRPAAEYRFRDRQVVVTDEFPAFRPRRVGHDEP